MTWYRQTRGSVLLRTSVCGGLGIAAGMKKAEHCIYGADRPQP